MSAAAPHQPAAASALDAATVRQAHAVLDCHARTFRLAGRLLPRAARDDAAVVYAFCRLVDDSVDEAPSPKRAHAALAELRAELHATAPPRPLVAAYLDVCRRCQIPPGAAEALFDGVASDLGAVQVTDDRELMRYCYRVAGTVGLMMSGVLGVREPAARPFAIDLGLGMQLTNICRDVAEDAAMGRVYLPRTRLLNAGTSPEALLAGDRGPRTRRATASVVRDLLTLADRYYTSGEAGMRYIPAPVRPGIAAAGRVYRAIGLELRARDHDALSGRAIVSTRGKLRWLASAVAWSPLAPLGAAATHDPSLHRHLDGLPGACPPATTGAC